MMRVTNHDRLGIPSSTTRPGQPPLLAPRQYPANPGSQKMRLRFISGVTDAMRARPVFKIELGPLEKDSGQ